MNEILVLCTINDLDRAKNISKILLEDKLIACVNIIPKVTSLYRWQGEICEDSEYLMVLKSRSSLFEVLKNKISALHPYEVPEIISVEIKEGAKSYLEWLNKELK